MAQRRHHYESAFESYLRSGRIPYIAVDEARKTLLPAAPATDSGFDSGGAPASHSLKSFDFVVYSPCGNLLVDVKGRHGALRSRPGSPRLESWVTREDVESMARWEALFGPDFCAAFAFLYCHDHQPPDGMFDEMFEHHGLWYAVHMVQLSDYTRCMRPRSPRWRTLHIAQPDFQRIGGPLCPSHARPRMSRPAAPASATWRG
jgi:hypothetical protein